MMNKTSCQRQTNQPVVNLEKYVHVEVILDNTLGKSTFTLIFPNPHFQQRFYEALSCGSIPVVLSLTQPLPFQDLINWNNAIIRLPELRLLEIEKILKQMSKNSVSEYRRKGRFYLENYLGNSRG